MKQYMTLLKIFFFLCHPLSLPHFVPSCLPLSVSAALVRSNSKKKKKKERKAATICIIKLKLEMVVLFTAEQAFFTASL